LHSGFPVLELNIDETFYYYEVFHPAVDTSTSLLVGYKERDCILMDSTSGKIVRTMKCDESISLMSIFASTNTARNPRVVTGDLKGCLTVWDMITGIAIRKLQAHSGQISVVAYFDRSDSTPLVISGCYDESMILW
jgi:WD40 repeat protein